MRPPTESAPVERQNDDSRAAATGGSRSSATLRTALTVMRRSHENPCGSLSSMCGIWLH